VIQICCIWLLTQTQAGAVPGREALPSVARRTLVIDVSYRRQCACSPAYLCVCFFVFRSAGALCCTSNTLRVRCSVHFTWLQSTTAAAPVWPPPCHWLCPHMPSSISKILELPCPCFCVSFIH